MLHTVIHTFALMPYPVRSTQDLIAPLIMLSSLLVCAHQYWSIQQPAGGCINFFCKSIVNMYRVSENSGQRTIVQALEEHLVNN
jgi:hypothetical protein